MRTGKTIQLRFYYKTKKKHAKQLHKNSSSRKKTCDANELINGRNKSKQAAGCATGAIINLLIGFGSAFYRHVAIIHGRLRFYLIESNQVQLSSRRSQFVTETTQL